jgi:hypothetical protein
MQSNDRYLVTDSMLITERQLMFFDTSGSALELVSTTFDESMAMLCGNTLGLIVATSATTLGKGPLSTVYRSQHWPCNSTLTIAASNGHAVHES